MDFDINSISAVLGVLGAYFAILLVLSVSVETILEPFTFFKGLQKQANPDDVVKEVQEWLPEGSGEAAKVVAIETFAAKARVNMAELDSLAESQAKNVEETLKKLGLDEQVDIEKKKIAIKLSALREKYASSQKQRITILRTLSAVIGIVIAFALQINTFDILGSFFSGDVASSLNTPAGQIGGIIVTGLAASAGSSFWHDMLGRVRNIKDTVKQVEKFVKKDE
jgi:ABC-type transporter Mla maintaining outer membrane lipid asymmetry permease subunit MlaE